MHPYLRILFENPLVSVVCCSHRYVENGSLANIIKPNKFGPFPERCPYTTKLCVF
jgi:hypothetical protein